jgi:hypothetical protein
MTTGTQNPPPDALDAKGQVSKAVDAGTKTPATRPPDQADTAETDTAETDTAESDPQQPASPSVTGLWWLAAIVGVVSAAWLTVVVARGIHFTTGQRAAAAGTALLVVVALAIVAQIILMRYQARLSAAGQSALPPRRQGLKAAVMGHDNRASTSKTQVVLWTAAVVWALIDLLLLARAHSGANLFTTAMTNWRPEYLVLLGFPVVAAATAKAAVGGANSGHGPATDDSSMRKMAKTLKVSRVYMREPAETDVKGFWAGVAELFTGDDNSVDWGDLQYVVFTLVTLTYFVIQFLAQPANGLPPVPAALLTLTGVSATGYAANKIVSSKVNLTDVPDGQ